MNNPQPATKPKPMTAAAAKRQAWLIHRDPYTNPQNIEILCPVKAGGYWCQWVAGHYGACQLGRSHDQQAVS